MNTIIKIFYMGGKINRDNGFNRRHEDLKKQNRKNCRGRHTGKDIA